MRTRRSRGDAPVGPTVIIAADEPVLGPLPRLRASPVRRAVVPGGERLFGMPAAAGLGRALAPTAPRSPDDG
ncbi:hypothetical protein [Streptomyces eurythermus]